MARAEQLRGGAGQGDRIDAGMVPESAILDRDQQVGEQRRRCVRAKAPDATGAGKQCQWAVMAVEDFAADGGEAREVGREGVVEQGAEGGECEAEGGQKSAEGESRYYPSPCGRGLGGGGSAVPVSPPPPTLSRKGRGSRRAARAHSAATMVIRAAACRANTAGRYMSATSAPGSSNVPGVTARTRTASRKSGFSAVSATTAA